MSQSKSTDFDPQKAPRFTEIPTFMRCPLSENPDEVDIALIGVPYDGGVTNRPGARHGPREIRNSSSLMRPIHHVTRFNPFEACRVADMGDVRFSSMYDPASVVQEIESFYSAITGSGVVPLSAGGDHSITYPILKALGRPMYNSCVKNGELHYRYCDQIDCIRLFPRAVGREFFRAE